MCYHWSMKVMFQNNASNHSKEAIALLISLSVAGMLFAGLGGISLSPAFGATSYNNVQVFVQTTNITQGSFTIAAYNSSGSLVASTQTIYPAGGFELPTGEYLFTVTAENESQGVPTPVPLAGSTGESGGTAFTPSTPTVIPVPYKLPDVEYGYLLQQVSGSESLTIKTMPIENITLTKISVKVQFVNGTAAAGASVSASVVGAWYWWYGPAADMKLYAETGSDGMANLTVPAVPVDVTAWDWVRVNVPANATTISVNIGGETVNVTVYWKPLYVGLGGSALIIPPDNSTTITLHIQEPSYWYLPGDVTSGATAPSVSSATAGTASSGSVSNGATGVPATISSEYSSDTSSSAPTIQTQISPITTALGPGTTSQNTGTATQSPGPTGQSPAVATTSGNSLSILEVAAVAGLALAVAGLGLAIRRGRKSTS